MDRSKFEHSAIVPSIVERQLPAKASRGLDLEIRSEYPFRGIGNYICWFFTSANVASDYNHR